MNNTITTTTHSPGSASVPGVFTQITDGIVGLGSTLLVWNSRYQARRRLAEMPEHLLSDMGISRAEADREAAKPFWRA